MKRNQVYITNLIKFRPPDNRRPAEKEIEIYGQFLNQQIEIIKPKIIICLGDSVSGFIMKKYGLKDQYQAISRDHGRIFEADNKKITLMYHPAATLYNNDLREIIKWEFKKIKNKI